MVASEDFCIFESVLSFRTERSGVKNLDGIHLCALEILRFALDDNTINQPYKSTTKCLKPVLTARLN